MKNFIGRGRFTYKQLGNKDSCIVWGFKQDAAYYGGNGAGSSCGVAGDLADGSAEGVSM